MKAIREAIERVLRGPATSGVLARCGVEPKKFWLLMDLFAAISERGEMMDQLGRNGVALGTASILYALISAFLSLLMLIAQRPVEAHLALFLVFTGVLFTSILLSEAGNSLINPAEAMVLAHQPIPGATYTAAKLSHLLRIVLWLTPALNGIPALAGLLLPGARWWYPALHLGAALGLGLVAALAVCAAFGWLMRFVPAKRLKAVGQFVGAAPFVAMPWIGQVQKAFPRVRWNSVLPESETGQWAVAAAAGLTVAVAVGMGLRALSADYLIRVSAMMRGGARGGARSRRSWGAAASAALGGGQGARAGFLFVSRLMRRDWQFRRQAFGAVAPLVIAIGSVAYKGWSVDPFGAEFSPMHVAPHALGVLLAIAASILPFGNDYKGAWVFSLAGRRAMDAFARGVYGVFAEVAVAANLVAAPVLLWRWGAVHGGLFVAYSLAASLVYVAVAMKTIDAIPFTQQANPQRAAITMPVVMVALLVIGMAVGVQWMVFRSETAVAAAVVVVWAGAWFGGKWSVRALAGEMEFQTAERGVYREVEI